MPQTDYIAAVDAVIAANTALTLSVNSVTTLLNSRTTLVNEFNALVAQGANTDVKRAQISSIDAQLTDALKDQTIKSDLLNKANTALYTKPVNTIASQYLTTALDGLNTATLDALKNIAMLAQIGAVNDDQFIKSFAEAVLKRAVSRGNSATSHIPKGIDSLAYFNGLARV